MKKNYRGPLALLAGGLVLILISTVGATRAAVVYQQSADQVNFSTAEISVALQEGVDGDYTEIEGDDAITFSAITDEKLVVGKKYSEDIRVVNDSDSETGYSEYVRVVVKKSWYKDDKNTDLDPSLIKLEVADGWYLNEDESTTEQSVYYMTSPLACGNAASFITGITIDNEVNEQVVLAPADGEVGLSGNVVNEYIYQDEQVYIQLQADAVQTHNAEAAINGAWGIKATCDAEDDGNIVTIGGKSTQ